MCTYCNAKHQSDEIVEKYYDPLECECGHNIFQHNYDHPHSCMLYPDAHCVDFKLVREYKMQVQL